MPVDPSIVEVEQVWYPSKDGTKISMFLVHKKGLVRDGDTPTLLDGYGGFNVSDDAGLLATLLSSGSRPAASSRCRTCAAAASTATRGTRPGMLDRKQNVFDDFIAAAEWLIAQKLHAARASSAISGGSNGGLLTGAASRSGRSSSARRSSPCRCSTCCATRTS